MPIDSQSFANARWNCKYHIVFAPKHRRKEFYGLKRLEIGAVLRKLCEDREMVQSAIDFKGCPLNGHVGPFRGHV